MEGENNTNAPQATMAQTFAIPFAIIVAGLAIAAAVYFGDNKQGIAAAPQPNQAVELDPITEKDHLLGNPQAKVTIVEYSDTECPFCKVFHNTMNRVMSEYGNGGQVAWVYRQFPIAGLHPKAHKEAEATECANKLGGNTKFWEYLNKMMEVTPSNNGLDAAELPKIAETVGLDVAAFNKCLSSDEMKDVVDAGIASAAKAGAQGTPYSLVVVGGKIVGSINGAQPYETVKAQIDGLLK